jgi:hypothetical protein
MLCPHCRSLRPELRRYPRGSLHPAAWAPALRALVCERCGAPARPEPLPVWLRWLERAGLGSAGPLLCDAPRPAA